MLVEFLSANKSGKERFTIPLQDICLLGETKKGCCVLSNDGNIYDVVNTYDDVKNALEHAGIAVLTVPVPVD